MLNDPLPSNALQGRPLLLDTSLRDGFFLRAGGRFKACFCWSSASLAALVSAQSKYLRDSELEYLSQPLHDNRRRSYLLGRYCSKEALSQYSDSADLTAFAIVPGVFQQPIVRGIADNNLQVSISHCGDWAIAVSFDEAHPLGVDIEAVSSNRRETIQSQLTVEENEMAALSPEILDRNLACIWTAKEALSKVLKTGMMTPFNLFEVEKITVTKHGISGLFKSFAQYRFMSVTAGDLAVSVVCPKQSELDDSLAHLSDDLAHSFGQPRRA